MSQVNQPSTSATRSVSILARLLPYAEGRAYLLTLAMLCSALSGVALLMPVVFIYQIVRALLISQTAIDVSFIQAKAIWATVFAVSGSILYLLALLCAHLVAFKIEENIIRHNTHRLIHQPLGFFTRHASGKLRKELIDGAAETHAFLAHQLPDLAMTLISPVVVIFLFLVVDWRLGLASLCSTLLGFYVMSTAMSRKHQQQRVQYYEALSQLSAEMVEYVRAMPVVKAFAQSVESFERLHQAILTLKQTVIRMSLGWRGKMTLFETLSNATAFFVIPVALLLISLGQSVADILSGSVICFLIGPLLSLYLMRSMSIREWSFRAKQSLDGIEALCSSPPLHWGQASPHGASLRFDRVCFSYGETQVLQDISFHIEPGQTVALVGPSGSGKSTVARLAARFYDVSSGQILINETPLHETQQAFLMQKIAFVLQQPTLFKMSLRNNFRIAKADATDAEIEQALMQAGAEDIIARLPQGLDTVYGSQGTYFSGGEMQRLSLARAFLKNADILILDEATAFADPDNAQRIQAALTALAASRTTLIIAHQLSSVMHADQILVLDQGRIVERGSHRELLANGGLYHKLWQQSQEATHWRLREASHGASDN
ncbi:Vitamin B12 import ATP-binding protein BtuD [Oligella sp. MSHR50489EDL]|uniref:ABC transporter ATP-binding protein n=1 Tax=Oligella sp. MSHR50489EDL TaxID=3139409 RepID=UPI003D817B14